MAKRAPRVRKQVAWSSTSTDPTSIADIRVCLVLMRMYRGVDLPIGNLDLQALLRPFWPALREARTALCLALRQRHERDTRRESAVGKHSRFVDLPDWASADSQLQPPEDLPDTELLSMLGEALVMDWPEFRGLYDAVEVRLESIVKRHRTRAVRNLVLLTSLLSLSRVEGEILGLCAAIELSSVGASLFSPFQRPTRQIEALQFGLQLSSDQEVRAAFSENSRLSRSGLLYYGGDSLMDLEETLRLSPQGSRLLSADVVSVDDMASHVLKLLPESESQVQLTWPHLGEPKDRLARLLATALRDREVGVNVLMYGAPGTGKTEFARALIEQAGAHGYSVKDADENQLSSSRQARLANLALSQIFAPAQRSVLVLDEAEDIFDSDYNNPLAKVFGKPRGSKSWMNGLLEGNVHPVIWISNKVGHIDPAYLRRFTYCMEFPTTPRGVRQAIARQHLEPSGCSAALIETIGSNEHVTPAMLASAARFIRMSGADGPDADAAACEVLKGNIKVLGKDLPDTVPRRATRFDTRYLNVTGQVQPEAVLAGLQRLGRGTLLLSGPPGTGKTQLAAEIADRLGRELIYKTASDINTMWFGESERNVAKMFEACDAKNEVLFLDEADTLLEARDASGNRANVAVTAEFLRRIEAFDGVFVCATNHPRTLDSALMRRFAFRLGLNPLDQEQRLQMFCEIATGWEPNSSLPPPALPTAAVARLARLDQLTPGDFANVVKRMQALDLQPDIDQWIDELSAEHDTKPGATRAAIGFV